VKSLIACIAAIVAGTLSSTAQQDLLPVQFRSAPLLYNPANAGLTPTECRATVLYNTQRVNYLPFQNTFSYFAADAAILKGKLGDGDALGIGISGMTRREEHIYNNTTRSRAANATVAYHKGIGANKMHHISLGFQASTVDWQNTNGYDSSGTSLHTDNVSGTSHFDYGIGIIYSGQVSRRSAIYAGYSIFHPEPKEIRLENNEYSIEPLHTAQLGWNYAAKPGIEVSTNVNYRRQNGGIDLSIGSIASLLLTHAAKHPTKLHAGGWYYYQEALVPYLGVENRGVRAGISYAINTANFAPSYSARVMEVSLTWQPTLKAPNPHWKVPRL